MFTNSPCVGVVHVCSSGATCIIRYTNISDGLYNENLIQDCLKNLLHGKYYVEYFTQVYYIQMVPV